MNTDRDSAILGALERLAAQFRWDTVAIWVERKPDGEISFTAYIPSDYARHADSAFGHGPTLAEACRELEQKAGSRDPNAAREQKIAELEEQIRKLKALDLSLPPYRPGTRLAAGALTPEIEIETQSA